MYIYIYSMVIVWSGPFVKVPIVSLLSEAEQDMFGSVPRSQGELLQNSRPTQNCRITESLVPLITSDFQIGILWTNSDRNLWNELE